MTFELVASKMSCRTGSDMTGAALCLLPPGSARPALAGRLLLQAAATKMHRLTGGCHFPFVCHLFIICFYIFYAWIHALVQTTVRSTVPCAEFIRLLYTSNNRSMHSTDTVCLYVFLKENRMVDRLVLFPTKKL